MSQKNPAAIIAELTAKLAAAEAKVARSAKKPGWYVKTCKPSPKTGRCGRFSAERVLDGGVIVSFYVGHLGKLAIGSGYGTNGVSGWANDRDTIKAYLANGLDADLDCIPVDDQTGWANG
jgi:hypothetical protein